MVTLIVSLGEQSIRRRVQLGDLDSGRAFIHRQENNGLTMHIPPVSREITNEEFRANIEDLKYLTRIAELT